jgi:predicted RNA-binding Zn ribbon-like protein
MNFDSYTDRGVEAAAELVNQLTPGWDRGRQQSPPTESGARRRLAAAVELAIWGRSGQLSSADAEGLFVLAEKLMLVFDAAARGEEDAAAPMINSLLQEYNAAPQLAKHDGEPWHLHFHSQAQEAGRARARGATCATALAIVIGTHGTRRLGVCGAVRCDRVYIDTSRNGSRRFCSPSCLSRQKVAAFRARKSSPIPVDQVSTRRRGVLPRGAVPAPHSQAHRA